MSKVKISNLNDFDKYRSHCPFCKNKLKNKTSKLNGKIEVTSTTSIEDNEDDYIITYDSINTFSATINLFIEKIIINKETNSILYKQREGINQLDYIIEALRYNKIAIIKYCNCPFEYKISTNYINLIMNNDSFIPYILYEKFNIIDDGLIKISNYHECNETDFEFYKKSLNDCMSVKPENIIELPFINFNYNNIDDILKKVRMITTFL